MGIFDQFCRISYEIDQMLASFQTLQANMNNLIGQLNSIISITADAQSFAQNLNFNVNAWDVINDCPTARSLAECMEPLVNLLKFGSNLGFGANIVLPCLNIQLDTLLKVNFSCTLELTEAYKDEFGRHPKDDLDQLGIPTINPVTNLRYFRQGADVVLTWDDNDNGNLGALFSPVTYKLEVEGIHRTTTLDKTFTLSELTPARPTVVTLYAQDRKQRFQSAPTSIEVIAFDGSIPPDVTNLQVLSASQLEALISFQLLTYPNIRGYNIRWRTDGTGNSPEKIYWVGRRNEVMLSNLFNKPTIVTVTSVTEWDESNGATLLVTLQSVNLVVASFDQASYNLADPFVLDLDFNTQMGRAGIWQKAYLTDGLNQFPISSLDVIDDGGGNVRRRVRIEGTVIAATRDLKVELVSAIGEKYTNIFVIP